MGETTGTAKYHRAIGDGNGGLDFKKIVIWVLAITVTLIGVIYAKDTSDLKDMKAAVDTLKSDSSKVNTEIAVIKTEITTIKDSQKRMESDQKEIKDDLKDLVNAVNQLVRDTSRRNP